MIRKIIPPLIVLLFFSSLIITAQDNPTLVPSLTPTPLTAESTEVFEFDITAEPTPVEIPVRPAEGQEIAPPLTLTLPEGWQQLDSTILIQDVGRGIQILPFTAYIGPVTGGEGFIIVLWGFQRVAPGAPSAELYGQFSLGRDGARLLRLAVTDIGCNIGGFNDLEYDAEFAIGDRVGYGATWAAVDCPESVDTRGWFAALNHEGLNFVFYTYAEPIEAMDGPAPAELQAVLDTIEFQDVLPVLEELYSRFPTPTPGGEITPDVTGEPAPEVTAAPQGD